MTKFLNISTDNTLGGSSASDETVSSQKAIKDYVDNNTAPAGSYVTTNTIQDIDQSATKTFYGRVNFYGTGDSYAMYLSTDTRIDVKDTTNTVLGFARGTFLINNPAYALNLRGSGARPAWNDSSYIALTSDIGNATLTIQKNGVAVDTFKANATSDKTINITVPTKTSDLTNDDGFITGINSSDVTTALGYTPYDASNPNGYTSNTGTVTSVNNTSPDSNGNVSLSIPTVNNPTITFKQGGTTKGTITLNQSGDQTIAFDAGGSGGGAVDSVNGKTGTVILDAEDVGALPDSTVIPTDTSDLTNGAGFITSSALSGYATQTWVGQQGYLTSTALNGYATEQWVGQQGYITGITSSDVTTALGYTPYDASNPNGYTSNVGTVTSVNNVQPVNGNVSLSIPSEVTESTVSGWGFTKNTGTVTSVNNVGPVDGNVTISIPTVDQSYDGTSTNAQSGVAVKSAIDSAISSVYKPAGSVAFASLPALSSSIEGYVYNVTDSFTTTSDFVEGAGKTYPAGTNIVCIDVGSSVYKWDVLSGVVDLSGYVPTSRTINNKALTSNITLTASDVGALPDSTVIPTVNNATLTIQKNGTNVATFTANSSSNKTANITVPTDTNDLTNGAGFITGITSSDVTAALGYTPYNSTNPSGYQANVIETVKVNGTALTPSSKAVDITVPTNNNQLTNGAGYITSSELSGYQATITGGATTITSSNLTASRALISNSSGKVAVSAVTSTELGYLDGVTSAIQTQLNNKQAKISAGTANNIVAYSGTAGTLNTLTRTTSVRAKASASNTYIPTEKAVATSLEGKYDASNPAGYTSNVGTVTSVNNVSPVNGNVSLTIPTVNNATLTIQKNGTTVKTFTANASSNVTCNITVPTDTSDLTNGAGYTTNVGTVTSVNNVSPVNGNVTLSIPSEVTESTVSGWGFTKNAGTVTSVNNVSPVNGNVTLSIPSINNLANKDLSNLSTTGNSKFQAPLVSGTNIKTINNTSILGSGNISIQADPAIDSKSITQNSSDELQTVGVIDQNATTTAIKTWTGTLAQYNSIATKDANTLYNITDDTDTALNLLQTIYPVGSIYIGTMSVCPLSALFGTWQKVSSGRVLQGSDSEHSAGSTIEAGLPNIEGKFLAGQPDGGGALPFSANSGYSASGALSITDLRDSNHQVTETNGNFNNGGAIGLDASRSSSIYGNSTTVQPPAFVVNIWQRTE